MNIRTKSFTLRTYRPAPAQQSPGDTLTVYIEGDGFAWKSRFQPSMDPTPDDAVSLKLALSDNTGHAAYLARPCQFTLETDRRLCHSAYWTTARYSKAVIESMDQAVSALKRVSNAQDIRLVGYSGGGVVAALLAAQRTDVVKLVTLAANLDTSYWTSLHGVTPLYQSLNPAAFKSLKTVPQKHFVGSEDEIVPKSVLESYLRAIGRDPKTSLRSLAGIDHTCCWSDMWPKLQQQLIN